MTNVPICASRVGLSMVGCIVIHRHGARAPVANLFAPDPILADTEETFWRKRTSPVDHQLHHLKLNEKFPTVAAFDTAAITTSPPQSPFGALTDVGADQLLRLGRGLRERYFSASRTHDSFATHQFVRDNNNNNNSNESPVAECHSTGFSRTIRSAQFALHGLHNNESSTLPSTTSPLVDVNVHDINDEPWLCAWESQTSSVLGSALRMAETDIVFVQGEKLMADTKQTLIDNLPRYQNDPTKFLWVHAGDLYTCRQAHEANSIESHAAEVDAEVLELKNKILNHVAWRFVRWFRDPEINKGAAAGLLRQILDSAAGCGQLNPDGTVRTPRMVLLSVHDVAILPLVLALGAHGDLLMDMSPLPEAAHEPITIDGNSGAVETFYQAVWPGYGTALEFQVAVESNGNTDTGSLSSANERWVRALYRGKVLPLLTSPAAVAAAIDGTEPLDAADEGRGGFVRLSDLKALLSSTE